MTAVTGEQGVLSETTRVFSPTDTLAVSLGNKVWQTVDRVLVKRTKELD